MTSLVVLAACALVPWLASQALKRALARDLPTEPAARDRALGRYRRGALASGNILIVIAAMAGALLTDRDLLVRWPTVGSWFFSSLCMVTAWVSMALSQRTPEEVAIMSHWVALGRAVQMSLLVVTATALALLVVGALQPSLPIPPILQAFAGALLTVAAVVVVSPWLMMRLGIWRLSRRRITVHGVMWRLAHLPAPTPFLTHAAALPWLRTVLLSDRLLLGVPEHHVKTLVSFEVSQASTSRRDRAARWMAAIPLSLFVFIAANIASGGNPQKLVAAMSLAVYFCLGVTWLANRQPSSQVAAHPEGPSLQELAQTLRSLPPSHGQAFPRTSHKPLGSALYDRLFALGHDPGPRPR